MSLSYHFSAPVGRADRIVMMTNYAIYYVVFKESGPRIYGYLQFEKPKTRSVAISWLGPGVSLSYHKGWLSRRDIADLKADKLDLHERGTFVADAIGFAMWGIKKDAEDGMPYDAIVAKYPDHAPSNIAWIYAGVKTRTMGCLCSAQ